MGSILMVTIGITQDKLASKYILFLYEFIRHGVLYELLFDMRWRQSIVRRQTRFELDG